MFPEDAYELSGKLTVSTVGESYLALDSQVYSAEALLESERTFSHGTAVFFVRTPNEIVVAADSRSVDINDNPDATPDCKIRTFVDHYTMAHGMIRNIATGYDVLSILKAAAARKGLLADRILVFETLTKGPLERALSRIRRNEPVAFRRPALEMAPLGVTFFGVERGILVLHSQRFVTKLY